MQWTSCTHGAAEEMAVAEEAANEMEGEARAGAAVEESGGMVENVEADRVARAEGAVAVRMEVAAEARTGAVQTAMVVATVADSVAAVMVPA